MPTRFSYYSPFGSCIQELQYAYADAGDTSKYRFEFNNQEQDKELGEYYAFEYRMHDSRLGRFLSVDPLKDKYPWNSTYAFAENRVIDGIELEGLEYLDADDARINCQQDNGDETHAITLGGKEFSGLKKIDINGNSYYDLRQHMYYGDNGWSESGSRSEQVTDETRWGIGIINYYSNLPMQEIGKELPWRGKNDEETTEITIKTRNQVDKFFNTGGICFYSTLARTNNQYKRITNKNGINPKIDISNKDYSVAATYKGNNLGYGAAAPFINKGLAKIVTNEEIWNGALQIGAPLQIWYGEFGKSFGHSFTFIEYSFDENGNNLGFYYMDSHGITSKAGKINFIKAGTINVVGANLIDP